MINLEVTRPTIGLLGGMSWHSTMTYYRVINETVAATEGHHASARISLQSLDFDEIRDYQVTGRWDVAAQVLGDAAAKCESDGASAVAICTNLMHKVAPEVEGRIGVPLIHIADTVAAAARSKGWSKVGLLGTRWVMEEDFYADRLQRHGIEVVVPGDADRTIADEIIFTELTRGVIEESSRSEYLRIIDEMARDGAQAVVLACTEVGLLITAEQASLPLIDSADVHARELGRLALRFSQPTPSTVRDRKSS